MTNEELAKFAEIEERLGREEEEKNQRESDVFNALYVEWLQARAAAHKELDDDGRSQIYARIGDLALRITTMPVPRCSLFWDKLEVFENFFCSDGELPKWTDNRQLVMFAGIKADLMRIGIGRDN